MTSRDFVYWVQGFFEISGAKSLTEAQVTVVRNHLNMVFYHEIDPAFGDKKHVEKLHEVHEYKDKTLTELMEELEKPEASGRGAFPRFVPGGDTKFNC